MKRCPTCQKTYTDDSLNFCLADGATLFVESGPASSHESGATLIMAGDTDSIELPSPTQVSSPRGVPTEIMPGAESTNYEHPRYTSPNANISAQVSKPRSQLLTVGITTIAVLLLVLVGIGIALLMRGSGNDQSGANKTSDVANENSSNTTETNNSSSKNDDDRSSTKSSSTADASAPGSLNVTATSSSTRAPLKAFSYAPANALDNNLLTAWIEGVPGPGIGEWIQCDFGREVKLNRVMMTPGYFKTAALWKQNNRLAAATLSFSDGSSRRFTFPDLMQMQTLDIGGVRTRFVRLVIDDYYPGSVDSEDTPISEMSFGWEP